MEMKRSIVEDEVSLPVLLVLSSATKKGLANSVTDWISYLEKEIGQNHTDFINAAFTTSMKLQHHSCRIAIIARTREDAIVELKKRRDGKPSPNCVEGISSDVRTPIVFVFSGMGTQWWGMSRQLMNCIPHFRDTIKKIDMILHKCGAKWSLEHLLMQETDPDIISSTEIAQPSIFAVQIGLVEIWRSCGVNPHAIVGHSVGEVAAAYTAGLLTLEDAVGIIYNRGKQLMKTSGSGTMLAVLHSIEEIKDRLASSNLNDELDIATINSPLQIVISGKTSAIEQFSEELKADGIKSISLKVNNAFHSHQQDTIKMTFLKQLEFLFEHKKRDVALNAQSIPMLSTVTNQYISSENTMDPEYWWKNVRHQVKFKTAIEILLNEGYTVFLEIGPHPALIPPMNEVALMKKPQASKFSVTHSIKRPKDIQLLADDMIHLCQALGKLFVDGCKVDLQVLFFTRECEQVHVPTYPWQRVHCTVETKINRSIYRFPMENHALLGKELEVSSFSNSQTHVWNSEISQVVLPWMNDHIAQGNVILPATAYVETALAASRSMTTDDTEIHLENLAFKRFLYAPATSAILETTLEKDGELSRFSLRSRDKNKNQWTLHATGDIKLMLDNCDSNSPNTWHLSKCDFQQVRSRCQQMISHDEFYLKAAQSGFNLGDSFHSVNSVLHNADFSEVLLFAERSAAVKREGKKYIFHPAYMDAVFQTFAVIQLAKDKNDADDNGITFDPVFGVPHSIREMKFKGMVPNSIICHIEVDKKDQDEYVCKAVMTDAINGKVFCFMNHLKFAKILTSTEQLRLWSVCWQKLSSTEVTPVKHIREEGLTENLQSDKAAIENVTLPPNNEAKAVLVVPDLQGFSQWLKVMLKSNKVKVKITSSYTPDRKEWDIELKKAINVFMPTDIVITSSLDVNQDVNSLNSFSSFTRTQSVGGLLAIKVYSMLNQLKVWPIPTLWLLTRCSQAVVEYEETIPLNVGVQAVGITIMHEDPEFPVKTVDLPLHYDASKLAEDVSNIIQRPIPFENQIALRPLRSTEFGHTPETDIVYDVHAPRLLVEPNLTFTGRVTVDKWRMEMSDARFQFRHESTAFGDVQAGKVKIKVEAFMPLIADDESSLEGSSFSVFAGKITKKGKNVLAHVSDEKVIGLVDCLSSTILINEDYICKIPDGISFVDAVHIARKQLLPYLALTHIAQVHEQSTILMCVNDEVDEYETVITKIGKLLGVQRLTNIKLGRETSALVNGGESVLPISQVDNFDLIILRLGEDLKQEQISLICSKLNPFGKILFFHERNLVKFPPNIQVLSLDFGMFHSRARGRVIFQEKMLELMHFLLRHDDVSSRCESESPTKLLSEVSALRKVELNMTVVSVDKVEIPVLFDMDDGDIRFNPRASYLITGGNKGFGLEMVEWLANSGAGYIITFSRSAPDVEVLHKFDIIKKRTNINILPMRVDVTNRHSLKNAFAKIKENGTIPALEGIFHCAVVFHDNLLKDITEKEWNSVMAAKAYGALLLHQLIKQFEFPIKYFVMISSIIALIGNSGQASYCSANMFLTSLSQLRKSQGLPATVLHAGVINSTGFAARKGYVAIWDAKGVKSMSPAQLLYVLGCMIKSKCTALGITSMYNKKKYYNMNKHMVTSHMKEDPGLFSIFKKLITIEDKYLEDSNDTVVNKIRSEDLSSAIRIIEEHVCDYLRRVLGISGEVQTDVSPFTLGLDSMMSAEMSSVLTNLFGVLLQPVELLNDQITINRLSEEIYYKVIESSSSGNNTQVTIQEHSVPKLFAIDGPLQKCHSQLVCFPPNGGGTSVFKHWYQSLHKHGIQTVVVQPPGWEGRESEKPTKQLQSLVSLIGDQLQPILLTGKHIFYGHSLGSLIAFEVAHYIFANYGMCPVQLFVGGWYAPSMPYPHPNDYNIPFAALYTSSNISNMLREYGAFKFIDDAVLNNSAVLARLLPCFEAGLEICKLYKCAHVTQLPCDLTVFAGSKDEFIKPYMVDDWQKEINQESKFKKITLPGKHHFLLTSTPRLLKEIFECSGNMKHNAAVQSGHESDLLLY
uniref:oleoyl-[acyl-carrier-protein] hydrolase n=1 Tax=Saccoglossus kowalevskii TaxID=10224 RepID=A0ABM0M3A6_SACKO|nr:PREDICTED: probable polyketide synthase 16-like [Saccoglossus kowalevskii]